MGEGSYSRGVQGLLITIILGAYFTFLQGMEYLESPFRMADRSYGSTFFLATGFHGAHFSPNHHFRYLAAIWYWHFVDVVWLFLYFSIYWWGRGGSGTLDDIIS